MTLIGFFLQKTNKHGNSIQRPSWQCAGLDEEYDDYMDYY